jgi:hypothetical protein
LHVTAVHGTTTANISEKNAPNPANATFNPSSAPNARQSARKPTKQTENILRLGCSRNMQVSAPQIPFGLDVRIFRSGSLAARRMSAGDVVKPMKKANDV